MKRKDKNFKGNPWITFTISTTSGNCVPGSTDFSKATLRLLELDKTPGFAGASKRAFEHMQATGVDGVAIHYSVVEDYLTEADSLSDYDEDFVCPHDCASDCATCGDHGSHDCMKWVRLEATPFAPSRMAWVCSHDCEEEGCERECECEDDPNKQCECDFDCSHECESSCQTCYQHNEENLHDCMNHRGECSHDCHDSGCYDDYSDSRSERAQCLETLRSFRGEWEHALEYASTLACLNSKYVTREQSEYLQANYTIVNRWSDPIARVESILRIDQHTRTSEPRHYFPRFTKSATPEAVEFSDMGSIQHALVVADSDERKNAIAFLLIGQMTGSLNVDYVPVTYGMRSSLRDFRMLEAQCTATRRELVHERLEQDDYSKRLAHVIYYMGHAQPALARFLADYTWQADNIKLLAPELDQQALLNFLRYETSLTQLSDLARVHRMFNGIRRLAQPMSATHHPFYWVATRLVNHEYLDSRGYVDIPRSLASPGFREAFNMWVASI